MAAITGAAGAFWGPVRNVEGDIKPSISFSNEDMAVQTDNKTYLVTDPAKRYWDKAKPLKVEVSQDGSSWSTIRVGFQIQYAGGVITFPSADPDRQVRVSGAHYELEEKLGFFSWTLTVDVSMHEATDFQSEGWAENVDGNRSWTAQAEQHWRS